MNYKWHKRYLQMATLVAAWSKDPKRQVGCVLVDEQNRVVSTGYNGPPAGIDNVSEKDRLALTLHAEENALLTATRPFYTAYTWPYLPCSLCTARLVQAGVQQIVSRREPPSKWRPELAQKLCDIKMVEIILC
jgi:dCMP deaminase